MPTFPDSHRDLLASQVAILTTINPDGFPQTTALWFLAEDGEIKLSLNTARQKVRNLRKHPECSFFLMDPANPYRTMEVRARAEIQPDTEYAFADRVGKKYNSDPRTRDQPGESRVVVTLRPVKINTFG